MRKLTTTFALIFLISTLSIAQKLPFQGYLEESGLPVEGTRDIEFSLTAYGWTETFANVPVSNGIYNVVLGSTTPLPNTIFRNVSETPMAITVNTVAIGTITLYKPLLNGGSLVPNGESLFTRNLNNNDVGWFGVNGNDGFTQLLSYDETDAFSGALILGSFIDTALPELYLEGSAQANFGLGRFRVVDLPSGEQTARLEINRSNGGGQANLFIAQDDAGADPTGTSGSLDLWGDTSPNFQFGSANWEDHDLSRVAAYGSITDGAGWFYNALDFGAFKTGDGSQEYGYLNFYSNQVGANDNTLLLAGNLYESGGGGITVRNSTGTETIVVNGANREITTYFNPGQVLTAMGNTQDPIGSDPTGFSGYLNLSGTNGSNVQIKGKSWEDNDLPIIELYGNNDGGALRNVVTEVRQEAGTANSGTINLNNTDNGGVWTEGLFLTSSIFGSGGGGILANNSDGIGTITLNGNVQDAGGPDPTGSTGEIIVSGNGTRNVRIGGSPWVNNGLGNVTVFGRQDDAFGNVNEVIYAGAQENATDEWGLIQVKNNSTINITLDGSNGNITTEGIVIAGGQTLTSDKRLKKEIIQLDNSLQNTLKLRGTSYFWKDENKSQKRQIGVIAQEVEEIYPEFVHTNDEGFKSVNYAQMTAVLIEAVKELNAKIVKLEDENENLSAALSQQKKLNERITKLERLLLDNSKVAATK